MTATVVLTRAFEDSLRLSYQMDELNIPTLVMPLLEIEGLSSDLLCPVPPVQKDTIVIFISSNAVRYGLPYLRQSVKLDDSIVWVALGARTRSALLEMGLQAQCPVRTDSEGVLEMEIFSKIDRRHVVIVKGVGGRKLLANELSCRGALVNEWCCYKRNWPAIDVSVLEQPQGSLIFQAASGEILNRLTGLLTLSGMTYFFQYPVVVPSPRVADIAKNAGWELPVCAEDAGDRAFVDSINSLMDSNRG